MIWAIDTNVLLDILIPNAAYAERSLKALIDLSPDDQLIISPVVFAELASQFPSTEDMERFLSDTRIQLVALSRNALLEAAKTWKAYAKFHADKLVTRDRGFYRAYLRDLHLMTP